MPLATAIPAVSTCDWYIDVSATSTAAAIAAVSSSMAV